MKKSWLAAGGLALGLLAGCGGGGDGPGLGLVAGVERPIPPNTDLIPASQTRARVAIRHEVASGVRYVTLLEGEAVLISANARVVTPQGRTGAE